MQRDEDRPVALNATALKAAASLLAQWRKHGLTLSPHTAVILGSGLHAAGDLAELDGAVSVAHADIPGMPQPRVAGHSGRVLAGGSRLNDSVLLQGRVHHYEGYSFEEITFSVRLLHHLGVRQLVLTNAAGGIRSTFRPGDLMLISDHLAMADRRCPPGIRSEQRDLGPLWGPALRELADRISTPLNVHQGTYAMMPGPNYETPAEVRMLKRLGADAVGMSTVPEALQAHALGMRVLGVSCITNAAAGLSTGPLSHDEVDAMAAAVESEFVAWLHELLEHLTVEPPESNVGD